MILKNKRTPERIQLSYTEFQTKFAKEIKVALESYIKTENANPYFKANKATESDFYFDLQYIFNHSAPSITLRYIGINQDMIDSRLRSFAL